LKNKKKGGVYVPRESNTILVGTKPAMSYVLAVVTHFNSADVKEVTLKARGRAITTAIDTAEIVRRKFLKELKPTNIAIGTDEIIQGDSTKNVSTIEINMKR
jgi:DNA-binding protein